MIEWFDICVNEQVYLIMWLVSVYHRLNDEKSLILQIDLYNMDLDRTWQSIVFSAAWWAQHSRSCSYLLRYEDHHQMLAVTCIQQFPGKCYVSQLWHIEILGTVYIVDSIKGNWGISRIVWEKATTISSWFQSGFPLICSIYAMAQSQVHLRRSFALVGLSYCWDNYHRSCTLHLPVWAKASLLSNTGSWQGYPCESVRALLH